MIPMIYIIILVAWLLLFFGFKIKDYTFMALASMLLLCLGVYIVINGLTGVNNLATQALALAHWGIGGYVFIRSGMEMYHDKF